MSLKNDSIDFDVTAKGTKDATTGKKVKRERVMKKIIIHPRGPEDSLFQSVGVNGKVWQIRKGVEVEIPDFVYGVLRDAEETHFIETRDRDGDIYYEDRPNPRFTVEARG